jgi:putative FmdB family regulatory protein
MRLHAGASARESTMPIYEYQCTCGNRFEKFQRSASGGETSTCPSCGAVAPRALSLFAVPRGAGSDSGAADDGDDDAGGFDMGHGHSHGPGGHSHSHGAFGHSH